MEGKTFSYVPGVRPVDDPFTLTSPPEDGGLVEGWSIPKPKLTPFAHAPRVPGQADEKDIALQFDLYGGVLPPGASEDMRNMQSMRAMIQELVDAGRALRQEAANGGTNVDSSVSDLRQRLSVFSGPNAAQVVTKPPLGYAVCNETEARGLGRSCPLDKLLQLKEPIFITEDMHVCYPVELLQEANEGTPFGDTSMEDYVSGMETQYRRIQQEFREEMEEFLGKVRESLRRREARQSSLALSFTPMKSMSE